MRDLAKFLYTHNPFYLLSAGSVLFGLRTAFDNSQTATYSAWLLAGSLAGYTLLLTATAILIVRIGKVWDDARTIALLVLLMLVAISCSFDRLFMDDRTTAQRLQLMGCLFAIVVVESLIRGLSIRFPWPYRTPLYALLGLFFVYPLAIGDPWWQNSSITAPWRVITFPVSASLVSLTLIPAIRLSRAAVTNNGIEVRMIQNVPISSTSTYQTSFIMREKLLIWWPGDYRIQSNLRRAENFSLKVHFEHHKNG
jgi:hypothetical protein